MKFLVLLSLALSCKAALNIVQVNREGDTWKITVTGSIPPQPVFRITAGGDLTVRGRNSKDIHYVITGQVRGGDEAAARRVAEEFQVHNVSGQLFFPQPASVHVELPRKTSYISLWTPGGAIDAADLDGAVRADSAAGKITLDRISGDAEIHSGGGGATIGSVGGVVRCYSGGGSIRAVRVQGRATFESEGGDIQLGDVLGAVRAITAAGGIRIDRAGGTVYADTSGGPISILQALGLVIAKSAGGPIDIAGAPSVQCQSAGGTIRLNNVSGQLSAATEHGSIVAEILSGHPLSNSFLSTRGGDITVFIPSDTGVTIRAESHGPHDTDPIVSGYSGLRIHASANAATAEGDINGGGPLLRLVDSGGRIEIKKK
ncbi:MAG TPA: hypothetical protein VFC21_00960 [Bryobacteraceae bacterium]|nr:hypothetical protein [Bryobacteraceae bacterium]